MDERLKAMACRHLLLEQGALDDDKAYFTISAAEIKELLNTAALLGVDATATLIRHQREAA